MSVVPVLNPKSGCSFIDHISELSDKRSGAFSLLELVKKTIKFVKQIFVAKGFEAPQLPEGLENDLNLNALQIISLPKSLLNAGRSVGSLAKPDEGKFGWKALAAVRDVSESVYLYDRFAGYVKVLPVVGPLAKTADTISDTADLSITVKNYWKASTLEAKSSGDLKEAAKHTKKYYMMGVAKLVVGLAATIFGGWLIATGSLLVPVGLLGLSVATTALSLTKNIWKASGKFELLDLDKI